MIFDFQDSAASTSATQKADPSNLTVSYKRRTEVMDHNGIDQAVFMPASSYDKSDGRRHREHPQAQRYALTNRRRMWPTVLSGRHARPDTRHRPGDGRAQVDDRPGFEPVSWHHRFQGGAIDDPTTSACLELLDKLDMVAFVHCYCPVSNLKRLDRLDHLAECTDQPIVALDTLSPFDNFSKVVKIGQTYYNLYFDTAMMFSLGRLPEQVVNELGDDRLVFGSDPYVDPLLYRYSSDLFRIRKTNISEDARDKIPEGNARHLWNLD